MRVNPRRPHHTLVNNSFELGLVPGVADILVEGLGMEGTKAQRRVCVVGGGYRDGAALGEA